MSTLKIRAKLMIVGVALSVIPICLIGAIIIERSATMSNIAAQGVLKASFSDLDHITVGAYTMCQAQQDLLQKNIDTALTVAHDVMTRMGEIALSPDMAGWEAINQFTKAQVKVTLPLMTIGGAKIERNDLASVESPMVDTVKNLMGVTCTLFQRMNPEGDMLRISTNVMKKEGARAVGTFIPHLNADGTKNPVVSSLLEKKTYRGRAFVVDRWYVTAYEPILDNTGKVIGSLYVGIPQESVASLRKGIMATKVGETGYVFVLDSKGTYVISKDGTRDGESVMETKDSDGRLFIREMCEKAVSMRPGEIGDLMYNWRNTDEKTPRQKVARFMYFKPWDWIIGASAYTEEFYAGANQVHAAGRSGTRIVLLLLILTGAAALFVWSLIAKSITGAVMQGVDFAESMADGDFSKTLNITSQDEIGSLAKSMNRMTGEVGEMISALVGGVETLKGSSAKLSGFANEIGQTMVQMSERTGAVAGRAEEMQGNMKEVASAMEESAANITMVASSTTELSTTIDKIVKNSENARRIAGEAVNKTKAASEIVEALGKEAQSISAVTESISDISSQTNLLALNATIEAARAGEAGKGFAVVAGEIKALSDQTAQATKDIRNRIDTIQKSTGETVQVIMGISNVINDVERLVITIVGAMEEQNATTRDIAQNVSQVASGIDMTRESISRIFTFSDEMAKEIAAISRFTDDVATSSTRLNTRAAELSGLSYKLKEVVGKFRFAKKTPGQ